MKHCLNCQDNTRIFQLLIYWDCYRHWWKFKHGRHQEAKLFIDIWLYINERILVNYRLQSVCLYATLTVLLLFIFKKNQCYYCLRWFRHFRLLSENTYRKKLLNTFLKFRLRPTSVGFRYLFIYMDFSPD